MERRSGSIWIATVPIDPSDAKNEAIRLIRYDQQRKTVSVAEAGGSSLRLHYIVEVLIRQQGEDCIVKGRR